MPVLHVEDVPLDLYDRLRERAAAEKRPLPAEVVHLLRQALATDEESARVRHAAALTALRRNRWTPPAGTPDSATLLREDRER
jgi:plasmid stability protein